MIHSKDPLESKGQTRNASIRGARQDKGSERVIEIRGPARIGDRAKTPYQKVLPQYKQAAEKAINRESVPKNRKKLVRDYFDSIDKGKS